MFDWLGIVELPTVARNALAILSVAVLLAIALSPYLSYRRKNVGPDDPPPTSKAWSDFSNLSDPKVQHDTMVGLDFQRVPLMSSEQARWLPALEAVVASIGKGHRVMAQTNLGGVLRPIGNLRQHKNRRAFVLLNSKKVDFAVFDRSGLMVAAVENRVDPTTPEGVIPADMAKQDALRAAGVDVIEISPQDSNATVEQRLRDALG